MTMTESTTKKPIDLTNLSPQQQKIVDYLKTIPKEQGLAMLKVMRNLGAAQKRNREAREARDALTEGNCNSKS